MKLIDADLRNAIELDAQLHNVIAWQAASEILHGFEKRSTRLLTDTLSQYALNGGVLVAFGEPPADSNAKRLYADMREAIGTIMVTRADRSEIDAEPPERILDYPEFQALRKRAEDILDCSG